MSTSEQGVKYYHKVKKQVGKSLPVVVFTFGEAGAAKPCTRSCTKHWRQTQPLLRSNRAGVRWLSHRLWTRRETSPGQSKVRGIEAKTSLGQLFVQYKCTVMDDINGHYLHLPLFSLQGFPLFKAHQIGRATTGEPTLLE